jgi:hypothetical protein
MTVVMVRENSCSENLPYRQEKQKGSPGKDDMLQFAQYLQSEVLGILDVICIGVSSQLRHIFVPLDLVSYYLPFNEGLNIGVGFTSTVEVSQKLDVLLLAYFFKR